MARSVWLSDGVRSYLVSEQKWPHELEHFAACNPKLFGQLVFQIGDDLSSFTLAGAQAKAVELARSYSSGKSRLSACATQIVSDSKIAQRCSARFIAKHLHHIGKRTLAFADYLPEHVQAKARFPLIGVMNRFSRLRYEMGIADPDFSKIARYSMAQHIAEQIDETDRAWTNLIRDAAAALGYPERREQKAAPTKPRAQRKAKKNYGAIILEKIFAAVKNGEARPTRVELARRVECDRETLSRYLREDPSVRDMWDAYERLHEREVPSGSRSADGELEAWE